MPIKREYFYDLDSRGTLFLDGVEQDDPVFLDFMFRRLAPTANPDYPEWPWVCRCGDEMNYLRPADTALVFSRFDGSRLYYSPSLSVVFDPTQLSFSDDGVLYHRSPVGEVGRIVPSVAVELAANIRPWGPWYAFYRSVTQDIVPFGPRVEDPNLSLLRPRSDNECVGCGEANPHSFRLTFLVDRTTSSVRTWITPDRRMKGAMTTTHGGYVSLLLDETMGKVLSALSIKAPTARLEVSFRKPMLLGHEHVVSAELRRSEGRKHWLVGQIRRTDDNVVVAEAEGLFVVPRAAHS